MFCFSGAVVGEFHQHINYKSHLIMETLKITYPAKGYYHVQIDNSPINLMNQQMLDDLQELSMMLDNDESVKVVVFESLNPDFFIAHLDIAETEKLDLTPRHTTGLPAWPDVAVRFENAPYTTIAKIRGRARGVGSEFIMAMDIRFASREKAVLGQLEIGCGAFPGGGGIERLSKQVGRNRALEIVLGGLDYDACTAERYGWINRSIPDNELDAFVDNFARRIASFDKAALTKAKTLVNLRAGLVQHADLAESEKEFFSLLSTPEAQQRIIKLFNNGLQTSDFELNLGDNIFIQ